MAQQNQVLQQLGAHLQTPPRQVTTTKPRDIPVLELHQLQGLDATTQLQIFFELLEQCSVIDTTRVQIPKRRVSTETAALIHNHQTLHNCNSWDSLKELLSSHFNKEVNFDRAWQYIDSEGYDWSEAPQGFVNNFICRCAILETRFASEKLPNRDKIIKRRLWQVLPQEAKARLEGFLDEDYPLDKFVDRVELERHRLEANHAPMLGRVKPEKKNYPSNLTPNLQLTMPVLMLPPNQMLHPENPQRSVKLKKKKKKTDQGLNRTAWEITNFPRSTPKRALLLTLPCSFP